ncbi:MAG: hypothetical protein IKO65_00900 [Victivallales bacterium]|nr:hypothetical protein [Victivallales bacterium]
MLKVRNFGKKSSAEIKAKLEEKKLRLGYPVPEKVNEELQRLMAEQLENLPKEEKK